MTLIDALSGLTLLGTVLFGTYVGIVTYRERPRFPLWWGWLAIAALSLFALIAPWLPPLD